MIDLSTAINLGGSEGARAMELERRTMLSLYLVGAQEAGAPPGTQTQHTTPVVLYELVP